MIQQVWGEAAYGPLCVNVDREAQEKRVEWERSPFCLWRVLPLLKIVIIKKKKKRLQSKVAISKARIRNHCLECALLYSSFFPDHCSPLLNSVNTYSAFIIELKYVCLNAMSSY